ncbi:MAG: GTPase HflX [Ignavibacteriae bacterium]|nr:GTPase HflX [Ignavibacteriota bacterium]
MKELKSTAIPPERAIAVAVSPKGGDRAMALDHLDELEFLAETCGAEVIAKIYQERDKPDGSTAVGKGKVQEIKEMVEEDNVTLIIFDDDLTPVQVRNLEKELEVKVIDRSGLILDIFASRAQTSEAKTQVELAQLQYMLPRLTRMWSHLSKQFGGIGTKGPGETQIETDRRMVRDRIDALKERLLHIDTQRQQQRKGRQGLIKFALVGYTNAGKSTLMNAMTDSGVYVKDQLFATLDTTVRSIELPNGKKGVISDTVGFIRKLPTHLIASFRSTLAEASDADVLMHVVDVSHKAFREQIAVVDETLAALNIEGKPTILVLNKTDAITEEERNQLEIEYPGSVLISAVHNINLDKLLIKMQQLSEKGVSLIHLELPYSQMQLLPKLYDLGEITSRLEHDNGLTVEITATDATKERILNLCKQYVVE